jgi:predicted dehydrogenase
MLRRKFKEILQAMSAPLPLATSIGLIGCGQIAQTHLEALKNTPEVKLACLYDINSILLNETAKKYNVKPALSVDEMLLDPSIEAVIICTPPTYHFDLMKKALLANKHILCEKPFTIRTKDSEKIQRMASAANKIVMMASKFRFVQDVMEAKKLIENKTIGDVILFEIIFCSIVNMEKRWNSNPAISGGGVLIDNGSHAVDIIRYLVGPIKNVYTQVGKKAQNTSVEDTTRLHFESERGVIGSVDLSWSLYQNTPVYANIMGTAGTIEIGWQKSTIWNSTERVSKIFGSGYNKLDAFKAQIKHFVECLRHRTQPILNIEDAVASVKVIEAASKSISNHKWIKIKK